MMSAKACSPHAFDVGLAPHSTSNLYVDLTDKICGAFVATYDFQRHPIGSEVLLNLHLPAQLPLQARGVVEWQRVQSCQSGAPGCGVRFEQELSEEELSLLERFVSQRAPLLYV